MIIFLFNGIIELLNIILGRILFNMSVKVGDKVIGKVTGVKPFGAFVELPGGKSGLVHISEVANKFVEDINEHLKVNDEVEVKVLSVGDDGKISLSIKQAQKPKKERKEQSPEDFEKKLSMFLKDSEERMSTIKRQAESRRGGKGR